MNQEEFPCPCCGFLTFDEPPGSYAICGVCGWEDDHVQLRFPNMSGGANKESLYEAQQIWIQRIPIEAETFDGFKRDKNWRPLTLTEFNAAAPTDGQSYFDAAAEDEVGHYWTKNQ